MKIPLRPALLTIRRQSVKWIVIHHTAEFSEQPGAAIDNSNYQTNLLFNDVMEKHTGDINYHYVIERIKDDYMPIVTRPISFLCDWPDIPNDINKRAIHVAALGSYDFKIPEKRLYEVMGYRVINPMLKLFGLSPNKVKFHNEISSKKDLTCPGEFMDKAVLIAMMRKFIVK
jgi:N-acetylmuramoyl-L-alanine amidase